MTIARGEQMKATDITDLTFFPKGTILTFSSGAWSATSAAFKTIWKICNTANHQADPNVVPDLTNRFLRGGTASDPPTGNGKMTLSVQHLPTHSHTGSAANNGGHRHDFSIPRYVGDGGVTGVVNIGTSTDNYIVGHFLGNHDADAAFNTATTISTNNLKTGIKNISQVSDHSHTVVVGNTGGNQAFDVVPAFYTVIYIMKIA
jgi:hypothetical protein